MSFLSVINRHSELRADNKEINLRFEQANTKVIVCYKGQFLFEENTLRYFSYNELNLPSSDSSNKLDQNIILNIYLGEFEDHNYFIIQYKNLPHELEKHSLIDLRTAAFSSLPFDSNLLFYAQGLINWHFNHSFCAKCGSSTSAEKSGHSRICENNHCQKEHFPKIEPAVIFSVTSDFDGTNKILLARQDSWPEKRYSVLAGFAEHGESLEMAVVREAYEEVGLKVGNVQYIASQPWPFPASLMLGFSCETKQHDIRLIDQELEHAQWLSAQEIKEQVESGQLLMPFSVSISWQLVERWYKNETTQSLKSLAKAK